MIEAELSDCRTMKAEGPLLEQFEDLRGTKFKNKVRLKPLGIDTSEFSLDMQLTGISKRMGVPNKAIQGTVKTARIAWDRCLSGLGGRPKFKGARNRLNSILFPGDCKLSKLDNTIRLPGLGWVKFHGMTKGLPDCSTASSVRLVKKPSGWHAVVLFEEDHKQEVRQSGECVGIDTGFKDLAVLSNGVKYARGTELEKSSSQLARVQRCQSKKKTARIHEKIEQQRKDRNHKVSHEIVKFYQEIYITDDNLKGQARLFGKSVQSAGIAQLRQFILYKGRSVGRRVELVESRNTTLTCSSCGALTGPTGLSGLNVRDWECLACGAWHDRDVNAAHNILNLGVRYTLESVKVTGNSPTEPTCVEKSTALEKSETVSSQNSPGR